MSEESPQEHFEHIEHVENAAHEGTPFLLTVSVTIAILAVAAASVGSLETIETAATLTEQNGTSLLQNKTSDQWAFFQAKSIKKNAYELAARQGLAPRRTDRNRQHRIHGEPIDQSTHVQEAPDAMVSARPSADAPRTDCSSERNPPTLLRSATAS